MRGLPVLAQVQENLTVFLFIKITGLHNVKGRNNNLIPQSRIVNICRSTKIIKKRTSIYTIGYPSGLPIKITLNGKVIDNSNQYYFLADLDTYCGNSGSPVFNMETDSVEGILVHGHRDFFLKLTTCNASYICTSNKKDCTGEKVNSISVIRKYVK